MIWMTAKEAESRWGLKDSTVRHACRRSKKMKEYGERGLMRKSAGTWLVTDTLMKKVYGEEKGNEN